MFTSVLSRVAAGGAAVAIAATGYSAAQLDKAVDLSVDGQPTSLHVFGSTVGDALDKEGIAVGEHDVVVPAADESIHDGSQILVRYGRKLTVTIDGQTAEYWTTATTVDQALAELGIRTHAAAQLSVSRSSALGREGLALTVSNPRNVTVVVDGQTLASATSLATVADVLAQLQVVLGPIDRVAPSLDTPVTEGMAIAVARVEQRTTQEAQRVAYSTTKQNDASLASGQTKVQTAGVSGERLVTFSEIWVDGQLSERAETASTVTKAPVNRVLLVGTAAASAAAAPSAATSGAGINLANAAMWDRIAQCESGGNWHINTGNGYYGGLQFSASTWLAYGGADFASRADLASREQQITVANRYYAAAGLSGWGCKG